MSFGKAERDQCCKQKSTMMVVYKRGSLYTALLLIVSLVTMNLKLLYINSPLKVPEGDDIDTATVTKTTAIASRSSTKKKICALYAGPMKTGSTALENFVRDPVGEPALHKDNYVAYCPIAGEVGRLANCLHDTSKNTPSCKRQLSDFKSFVSTNAGRRNIFLGHEWFAFRGVNTNELATYLSPDYDIHVVVYYRRFYDWIFSLYNQRSKPMKGGPRDNIQTFREYLRTYMYEEYNRRYTTSAYKNYINSPGLFNVSIVNMHQDAANFDSVEAFACDKLNDAPHLCAAAKSRPPDEDSNPSVPLDWILFRQRLKRYYPTKELDDESWGKIEEKFDSMVDRPRVCLPDDVKDRLLKISLDAETSMTPESFYNSEEGLEGLKSDFERKIKTKLCDIDVEAIVMSPEWQGFLEALKPLIET